MCSCFFLAKHLYKKMQLQWTSEIETSPGANIINYEHFRVNYGTQWSREEKLTNYGIIHRCICFYCFTFAYVIIGNIGPWSLFLFSYIDVVELHCAELFDPKFCRHGPKSTTKKFELLFQDMKKVGNSLCDMNCAQRHPYEKLTPVFNMSGLQMV
jgi:hypothetical protein